MNKGTTVMNRMGDVLIALREAEKISVFPTRIQLQKFIYLADTLGQVVAILKPLEGHKTYRNGPYDAAIQNAVDSLAFRGIVRIDGVWETPSGNLATKYALTASGHQILEKFLHSPILARKREIAQLIGKELKKLGWNRIIDLVYAEPTYVATRPIGFGVMLPSEDGLTVSAAFLIAVMRRVVDTLGSGREASPEWITARFFDYLDDYDRNYGVKRGTI